MAAPAFSIQDQNAAQLADPALREGLLKYARRRLPAAEVEDLVQNTLTDALVAANAPSDPAEFRHWVQGIARHKIADTYRRRGRLPILTADVDQSAVEPSSSSGELRQWIESELPKTDGAQKTLHWLLREGDGESLDEIARDVDLPAPRVRQRVSRLRRHFHARWLALGAAGLLLLVGAGVGFYRALGAKIAPPSIAREPVTAPANLAQKAAASTAATPTASVPEVKSTPKQPAPRPLPKHPAPRPLPKQPAPRPFSTKQLAPNKPQPKLLVPSKSELKNALPPQQSPPSAEDITGGPLPSKKPQKL